MIEIHGDFETYSPVSLKDAGAHVYARHPETDILMLAYRVSDGPPKIWARGDPPPLDLFEALAPLGNVPCALFYAFNAAFERAIWENVAVKKLGWPEVDPKQWRCVMAAAAHKGAGTKLERTTDMLKLEQAKDVAAGVDLRYISQPGVIPGTGGQKGRRQDVVRFERVMDYCLQDVVVEEEVHVIVGDLPPDELAVWQLDQEINNRGIGIDLDLCRAAVKLAEKEADRLTAECRRISGYGPNQIKNLLPWINECLEAEGGGGSMENFQADTVDWWLEQDLPEDVRRVLEIRRDTSKSSVTKYKRAILSTCDDGRARGLLQYHGAATGRWAGRGVQPQNLPRGSIEDMDTLCELIKAGHSGETLSMVYGLDVLSVLSSACRGMVIAAPGHHIGAFDFSSIEAVVLAGVAGQEDKVEAFRNKECAYCKAAEKVFGHPVTKEEHPDKRQVGKTCELAFGYQGGYKAWLNFDSSGTHTQTEIEGFRDQWREAHPMVRALWNGLDEAAIKAVMNPGEVHSYRGISYKVEGRWLKCKLPSGRKLYYLWPRMVMAKMPWTRDETVMQPDGTMKVVKHPVFKEAVEFTAYKEGRAQAVRGYGGHWTENVVQAIARDIMVEAMWVLVREGYPIILTVHDEILIEFPDKRLYPDLRDDIIELMTTPKPDSWWKDWPIGASGALFKRYRK